MQKYRFSLTKKLIGTLSNKKQYDVNEGVFTAGNRNMVGRTSSAIQTISSRYRKLALLLTNISNSVLHLQEEIINREKKDTGKKRSFSYIQYQLISLNGLQISLFDEGLVRLYHMIAPIETLYFDTSGSFVFPIPSIKNKDGIPKQILIYTLTFKHPIGKSLPIAFFEYVTTDHNIISISQPFVKFKQMETKLLGCSKLQQGVVTDFIRAILQEVLQKYPDENLESYLTIMFKIATDISFIEENRKTRLHISYIFRK